MDHEIGNDIAACLHSIDETLAAMHKDRMSRNDIALKLLVSASADPEFSWNERSVESAFKMADLFLKVKNSVTD